MTQECVLEDQDLDDGGFSSEYQARLTEDYEGEKERTNHEENINKRHDYLKIRLDKANAVSKTKTYFICDEIVNSRNWKDLDHWRKKLNHCVRE